jgi:phage tail sheath protein FI
MQGKPCGVAGQTWQLANWLIDNIATTRRDVVLTISPDKSMILNEFGNEAVNLLSWTNNLHDSTYAVVDSGYKYMYDKYNDLYRWIPLNGDIAGLMARTDRTNNPWWSPAGLNRGMIKNVAKLAYNPVEADRDLLYVAGVNPVITINGVGTLLFGDKTFTIEDTAFGHINVRRLFIVLEKAITSASKYMLFEFNDTFTQSQFKNMVNPYLRQIKGERGITDFLVVCDATNNTPTVIDANQFVGDIYIKPSRSINWVTLNFVAVATGVEFSEVIGGYGA